jgi:hypothetical protein
MASAGRAFGAAWRYAWALPCTLVGALALLPWLACGARLPFEAITLGHVVLARSPRAMARWRDHERAHVRQCERWGPLFFAAYLAAGAWQWLCRRSAYRDNPFEVQARAAELTAGDFAPGAGSSRTSA